MKLQDKETLSIANAVKDVLEKKVVKEIKYPHKMYSPDGEVVTANNKKEHESYMAKGYTHDRPVKEVEEPKPEGEKDLKAKHPVKKSGSTETGKVVKEEKDPDSDGIDPDSDGVDKLVKEENEEDEVGNPLEDIITSPGTGMETSEAEMLEGRMDVATVTTGASNSPDEPIKKGARRYNVKVVKVHSGRGPMSGVEDLVTFKGKEKDLVKLFVNHYGFDGKDLSDLESDDDYLVGPGKIYGYTVKESSNEEGEITVSTSQVFVEGPVIRLDEPLEEEEKEVEESEKQKKYQAFFQKALKKFGVKSPAELEGEKKKEFFDYVDKNYDAEGE